MRKRLLAGLACMAAGAAWAQEACRIDQAQALLGVVPPPYARIEGLLADCARANPGDWHVAWLQGVVARDQGRLGEALDRLQAAARAAPPAEAGPLLDLAVVHERRNERAAAAAVYARVLQAAPGSRAALLGSARVARAQGDLEAARATYQGMLARDPQDADARLGLAWLDLDALRLDSARAGFQALQPGAATRTEAEEGLRQVDMAWRYRVDVVAGTARLAAGDADSASVGVAMNLNARDEVHFVLARNSRELAAGRLIDPTPLPSTITRLGYRSRTAGEVTWSLAYEHRWRRRDADEHRAEGSIDVPLLPGLNAFGGLRQGFGATQWRNRVAHVGLSTEFARDWRVAATVFSGRNFLGTTERAYGLNLHHESGPRGWYMNVGVARNPDFDNTVVHGTVTLPVNRQHAVLLGAERRSLGRETEARIGWRMYLP